MTTGLIGGVQVTGRASRCAAGAEAAGVGLGLVVLVADEAKTVAVDKVRKKQDVSSLYTP